MRLLCMASSKAICNLLSEIHLRGGMGEDDLLLTFGQLICMP